MLFLIYGEDNFRSRQQLAAARTKFRAAQDPSGLNVIGLRAADSDASRATEAIFSSPFLAEKKLVVLEGFCGRPVEEQRQLVEALGRQPESTVVIAYEEAGAAELKSSPLFELFVKQKYTVECGALTPATAGKFLKAETAALGVTLEPRAATSLVALVGLDAWRLHQELEKLAAYAQAQGQQAITAARVDELVSGGQEEPIFAFLDACVEGRDRQAVVALEKLFGAGVAELQVVAMLQKQFRLLVAARDAWDRGERDAASLAKKLGTHPFPAQKAMVLARRFTPDFLRQRHGELIAIERDLKTGAGRPRVLLDVFATRLAAACRVPAR